MGKDTKGIANLLLLGALCALPPLSIDMGLPALTALQHALHTTPREAGLTLTTFMVGFGLTPLAYGLVSDRYGRRPLLLAGLSLFTFGGLACTLSPTIGGLLAARFIQGAGASVGPTLAFAATRDRRSGEGLSRRLAALTMILQLAPVIAPSIGSGVLIVGGWRGVYALLTVCGLLLVAAVYYGFAETQPPATRSQSTRAQSTRLGSIAATVGDELRALTANPAVPSYGLIFALAAGAMFAYVAGSPHVIMSVMHASIGIYALTFTLTSICIVVGAFASGRLIGRRGVDWTSAVGLGLTLVAAAVVAAQFLAGVLMLVAMVPLLGLATFGFGLVAPAASHGALETIPERAGSGAALMNTLQMMCMGLASGLVAVGLPLMGPPAMPIVMVVFAIAALSILLARRRSSAHPGRKRAAITQGENRG